MEKWLEEAFLAYISGTAEIIKGKVFIELDSHPALIDFSNHPEDTVVETFYPVHSGGQRRSIIHYRNFIRHGKHIRWFPNGNKRWEENFVDGWLEGEARIFDAAGRLLEKNYYRGGVIQNNHKGEKCL